MAAMIAAKASGVKKKRQSKSKFDKASISRLLCLQRLVQQRLESSHSLVIRCMKQATELTSGVVDGRLCRELRKLCAKQKDMRTAVRVRQTEHGIGSAAFNWICKSRLRVG